MRNLIFEYSSLKSAEEDRDARIRAVRDAAKKEIEGIEAQYPELDNDIRKMRLQIEGEAAAMPNGIWSTDEGVAEIQLRPSWDITSPSDLRHWLDQQDKESLWEYKFDKAAINRICSGLNTANMKLPAGVERVETPTLAITLTKELA